MPTHPTNSRTQRSSMPFSFLDVYATGRKHNTSTWLVRGRKPAENSMEPSPTIHLTVSFSNTNCKGREPPETIK